MMESLTSSSPVICPARLKEEQEEQGSPVSKPGKRSLVNISAVTDSGIPPTKKTRKSTRQMPVYEQFQTLSERQLRMLPQVNHCAKSSRACYSQQSVRDELKAIDTENQTHDLLDLFAASQRDFNKDRLAIKSQGILQFFQSLVEQRFPSESQQDKCFNILTKACATRQIKIVQCDGFCYSWLATWMQKGRLCQHVWMIEVVISSGCSSTDEEHPNHYFLLVSDQDNPTAITGLKAGDVFTTYLSGDKPDTTLALLENQQLWLVDPALNTSTPMTSQNCRTHLENCSRYYAYPHRQTIEFSVVDHFTKMELPPELFQESERNAYRLLVAASFQAHKGDLEYSRKLGRTIDWLIDQKISPDKLYPDLLRPDLVWGSASLHCVLSLDPDASQMLQREDRPNNIDRIFCFRPDTDTYFKALRQEISDMLHKGITPEACLQQLDQYDCFRVNHLCHCQAIIPVRISSQYSEGTTWCSLGLKAFDLMNIDLQGCQQPSLKELLISLFKTELNGLPEKDAMRILKRFFTFSRDKPQSEYRSQLLLSFPELKQDVRGNSENISYSLIYHCFHSMRESLPEELKGLTDKWNPLDTLRVTCADSEPFQCSLNAFVTSAMRQNLSSTEMTRQLVKVHERALDETQDILKIALPQSLIEAGFVEWCEPAVSYYLAQKMESAQLPKPEANTAEKQLMAVVSTQVARGGDIHRISSNLARVAHLAQTVSECYPELSPELIKKNWTSCTRVLLSKFKLEPLRNGSCPSALTDYDELKIVQPATEHWNNCLCNFVHSNLQQGHNLSFVVKRLMKGIIQGGKLSISTPLGMQEKDWSYQLLIRFLEQQRLPVAELVKQYAPANQSLSLEWKLYNNKGCLPFVDSILIDYMNAPAFLDIAKRREAIKHFFKMEKFLIPPECVDVTGYYQSLLDQAKFSSV